MADLDDGAQLIGYGVIEESGQAPDTSLDRDLRYRTIVLSRRLL